MLRNPSGVLFGYGANANQAFYGISELKICRMARSRETFATQASSTRP